MGRAERVTESRHPTFTREEVEEILRRATEQAKAASDDGIRHEELLEAAREVGLDTDVVEAAAAEISAERATRQEREDVRAELTEERRRGWTQSLLRFLVSGALLTVLNLVAVRGVWIYYVLACWGLFVGMRGVRLLGPVDPGEVDRRLERRRRKRAADERRIARQRAAAEWAARLREHAAQSARRAEATARAGRDFEEAVEEGVRALLDVLARNLRALAARSRRPDPGPTDFARYVDDRRREGVGSPSPPARVRVELHPRGEPADEADRTTPSRRRHHR